MEETVMNDSMEDYAEDTGSMDSDSDLTPSELQENNEDFAESSDCPRTILNVPKIFKSAPEEPKIKDQFSSFSALVPETDNYLLNIKKRCKKKVGRKDKHLISPNPVFINRNGYTTTTSEVETGDRGSSNESSLMDSLDADSESILKDYLAILYGDEATSLERNEYDTSFLKLEDSASSETNFSKTISDAEYMKFKSIENKFEYRRDGSDGKPFICGICSKAFGQHSNIILHMRSHTGEKPYVCDVCSKGFSGKSDLNRHKNIHSVVKKYWCEECKRGFNDNSGFRRHKLIYHSAISKKCSICPKSYLAQKDLDRHMKTHNKPEKKPNPTKDSPTMVPVPEMKRSNPINDSIKEEGKVEIPTPIPSETKPTKEINSSPISIPNPVLRTPVLEKNLQISRSLAEDAKPHKCEQCNFACSKRSNLRKHIAYVHCLERFYKCDICYKGFKSSWALKRHKQVHSEEKIYQCELCEKGFNDTGSFKYHMKSHRGERSYQCEICAKSFILKSDLKKHMSSHIKRLQQAAEQETDQDMEVLIQSDDSFLNISSYV